MATIDSTALESRADGLAIAPPVNPYAAPRAASRGGGGPSALSIWLCRLSGVHERPAPLDRRTGEALLYVGRSFMPFYLVVVGGGLFLSALCALDVLSSPLASRSLALALRGSTAFLLLTGGIGLGHALTTRVRVGEEGLARRRFGRTELRLAWSDILQVRFERDCGLVLKGAETEFRIEAETPGVAELADTLAARLSPATRAACWADLERYREAFGRRP